MVASWKDSLDGALIIGWGLVFAQIFFWFVIQRYLHVRTDLYGIALFVALTKFRLALYCGPYAPWKVIATFAPFFLVIWTALLGAQHQAGVAELYIAVCLVYVPAMILFSMAQALCCRRQKKKVKREKKPTANDMDKALRQKEM